MKKIFTFLLTLTMVITVGIMSLGETNKEIISASAETNTYGDYEYTILPDGTVEISKYNGSVGYLTIPSTINGKKVTSMGSEAFRYCTSLISVTIPNSVTSIGDCTFGDCDYLTSVTIGDGVTSIGEAAFSNCMILESITIPNSVTSIGKAAFSNCMFLESVTIGSNVTKIGSAAFSGCASIKSISVDSNNENYSSQNGVLFNKDKTDLIQYPIGNRRTSYTIPNSVKSIRYDAFYNCTSLSSITIPNSVTSIGEGAFYNCSSLTNVTIPNSVTSIGDRAFYYCTSLKDVYYGGTKDDWSKITIDEYNNELINATIHYHTHNYTSSITKQPTCTATGVRTFTCSCGDSYTETIPALGHKYSTSWTIDKVATCTSTGSKSHHCTVCGAKKDVTAIPKTAHNYNNGVVTKQPTCTATGIRTYTCTVCGGTKTETIPATGHKFGSWTITKKATCKATGIQTRKCSLCGKTETKTIAKTAHSYKNINVNSTYFAKGYTGKKCSKCGTITGKKYKALLTMSSPKASSVSTTSLKLTWSKVKDAKGYEVYQNGKKIKTVSGTNYTVSKLKAGTTFTFTVKPYNSKKAYGNQSKVLKATTVKLGKISLNWKKTSGANGYQIQICPNNKFKSGVKSYTTTKTSLVINGLSKGKSYYVRLRAYKKSGSKYKYSVWSKIKKAVVK